MKLFIIGIIFFLPIYLFISCSPNGVSGGTTIGNPNTVSGIIVDSLGKGISGLRVDLLSSNFNPLADIKPENFDTTNIFGEYQISDLSDGEYYLNAVNNLDKKRIYADVIVDGEDIKLGKDTVLNMGIVTVNIRSYLTKRGFRAGCFLYLSGTEIYSAVIDTGYISINAPVGRVNLVCYDTSNGGAVIINGPNFKYIPVTENKELIIDTHTIIMAANPSGPTAPTIGVNCTYVMDSAVSTLLHPLEYRFRSIEYVGGEDWWIDSDTTEWSVDSTVLITWPETVEYKMQAQVRSAIDTTVITEFYKSSHYLKIVGQ